MVSEQRGGGARAGARGDVHLTLYMMKMSSASSNRPASTARATTQPGTACGGSATHTTDRLTCVRAAIDGQPSTVNESQHEDT